MTTANGWPIVPLKNVLREQKLRIGTINGDNLPLLGVSNVDGLHRSGKSRINDMSRYLRVERDWFAYNPMRINVGSIGWAKDDNQTGIISPDYVVFSCTEEVRPELIYWFLKHRQGLQAINAQTAGSVRERLYFDSLARIKFPLPPIDDQRRVVTKIDRVFRQIKEIQALRQASAEEGDQMCRSIFRDGRYGPSTPTPMHELVTWRKPHVQVIATEAYEFAGVYCFGRGVFRGQRRTGSEFAYKQLTQIRANEFIYPKLMAWEGALAVIPQECDGLYVSPEFLVFTVNEDRVLPEVLDVHFRSPAVWPLLSGASTGTNVRRKRLNPGDFLNYEFPLPPRKAQEVLRSIRKKVEQLHSARDRSAELKALLPSILDRAFKGAL